MQTIHPETGIKPLLIKNALAWRMATKVFDNDRLIPDEKIELLLETLRLAPSSINLQPWKFIVIKDKDVRKVLQELSMNQAQITDASHLLLLCTLKTVDSSYFDRLIQLEKQLRHGESALEAFKPMAMAFLESKTKEQLQNWMSQQVYIALGFLLTCCALLHIDACPIEGFDHAKVNKLLDLHKKGLQSQVLVAVGYRPEKDEYIANPKYRWPKEDVVLVI